MLRGKGITLDKVLAPTDVAARKCKIVCTMGPSCWEVPRLLELIDAGMNIARLNFSHGDHAVRLAQPAPPRHGRLSSPIPTPLHSARLTPSLPAPPLPPNAPLPLRARLSSRSPAPPPYLPSCQQTHGACLERIRAALAERPGVHVAIMLDTKGPEIRTGLLVDHKPVSLKEGQDLEIVTDYTVLGDATRIACSYATLPTSVVVGASILIADGTLMCTVKELRPASVLVRVCNSVTLGEKKNMNLPGVNVDLPTITEKDKDDLVNFGLKHNVDMIAASFVRKGSDIAVIRDTLGPAGRHIKVVAKIENQEGLHNYDEILAATDGIMVARGDLGMEIPIEKVFLAQKMMIRKANLAGKPVITATQMLESMITNARPTRAECSDVANAVLDGTDAVMLSGETANGSHPVSAVRYMARTCVEAEGVVNYSQLFAAIRESTLADLGGRAMSITEAVASSAVKTAIDLGAKAIIVCTESGNTARLLAKYRPPQRVLVLTANDAVARYVGGLCRGARSSVVPGGTMVGTDAIVQQAEEMVRLIVVAVGWGGGGAAACLPMAAFQSGSPRRPLTQTHHTHTHTRAPADEGDGLGQDGRHAGGGARADRGTPGLHVAVPRAHGGLRGGRALGDGRLGPKFNGAG